MKQGVGVKMSSKMSAEEKASWLGAKRSETLKEHFKKIKGKPFNPLKEISFWQNKIINGVMPAWYFNKEPAYWKKHWKPLSVRIKEKWKKANAGEEIAWGYRGQNDR